MNPEEIKHEQASAKRKVALIALVILTIALLTIAIIIAVKLNQTPSTSVADDAQCVGHSDGYVVGCQKSSGVNTGYVCKCVETSSGLVVNCGTFDTNQCPTSTSNNCPNGNNYAGACGSDGCAANRRPNYQCDSSTGQVTKTGCSIDTTCGTGSSSSSSSSSSGGGGNCTPVVSGNSISLPAGCPSVSCTKYTGPNTSPFCNESAENFTLAGGTTATVNPSCMTCQQIDCDGGVGVRLNNDNACTASSSSKSSSKSSSTSSVSSSVSSTTSKTTLPDTALFSDDYDPLILGIVLVLGGILSLKFGLIEKLNFVLTDFVQNPPIELSPKKRKISKTRKSFEDRFEEETK